MAPPTKRAKLSIEVIIIAEEDDDQADGERGRIEIEDVNVQMMYQQDIEAAFANNNHMDPEEAVEEAGQLDDTQVSQTEPENEEDSDEDEEEDEQIPEVNDNDLEEDNEGDRDYDHNLVGRKIRALYNNGWFTGKVLYHNTKMDKLNVRFSDDTDDYISCDEINDTDVQLL